jgi:hypothetical protein
MAQANDFDWVTAQAACSSASVFERLRMQIEQDVKIRQALRPKNALYDFRFVSEGKRFVVIVEGNEIYKAVRFSLSDTAIDVHDAAVERPMFQASLTLGDDGECRLKVGDKEYDFWQFRKLALEDVFFDGL